MIEAHIRFNGFKDKFGRPCHGRRVHFEVNFGGNNVVRSLSTSKTIQDYTVVLVPRPFLDVRVHFLKHWRSAPGIGVPEASDSQTIVNFVAICE